MLKPFEKIYNLFKKEIIKIEQFSGDCNDIMETSLFFAINAQNAPLQYGFITTKHASQYSGVQDFADSGGSTRYTRTKTNGIWSEWENVAIVKNTKFLATPLTNSNLYWVDNNIMKAKNIIVFYTMNYGSSGYRNSIVLDIEPDNSSEVWYQITENTKVGYIKTYIDKINNIARLVVSASSNDKFAVLGYKLIM